jgi:hypothetical protein
MVDIRWIQRYENYCKALANLDAEHARELLERLGFVIE